MAERVGALPVLPGRRMQAASQDVLLRPVHSRVEGPDPTGLRRFVCAGP